MTYCSQCGFALAEETGVCPQCGAQAGADVGVNPYVIGSQVQPEIIGSSDADAPEVPGFLRALRICFVEKYFSFKGRASRSEFWYFILWLALFFLVLNLLGLAISFFSVRVFVAKGNENSFWFLVCEHFVKILGGVASVYAFFPAMTVAARRFHDVGLTGLLSFYAVLILYAPPGQLVSFFENTTLALLALATLCILLWPGKRGPNNYGPAPRKRPKERREAQ